MRVVSPLLLLLAIVALLLPAPPAHASPEDEADRQLQLAEEDLAAGNFERAAASAASALRLDPARHDALVVRGLALQGLGRLEDAGALLRAYRDLRGTLPLDERVEPALADIAQLLAAGHLPVAEPKPEVTQDAPTTLAGPVAVVYGPDDDERAAEHAYAAARPFLGGEPASSILPLDTLLPRGDDLVGLGATTTACADLQLDGVLDEHLATAEAAVTELEPEAADQAAAAAELHLACGDARVAPEQVGRLLAARAAARWVAGEPEAAARLWQELYSLQPDRLVDSTLSPTAQALQLDAKLRATEEPAAAELRLLLAEGWVTQVDGRAYTGGPAAAGRRIVRLTGPDGQQLGAVLDLTRANTATVGAAQALRQAAQDPHPDGAVFRWLAGYLAPLLAQGAEGVLLVNLSTDPPVVRHFDGERFLILTTASRVADRGAAPAATDTAVPRGASAALLGGGLVVTAVGVIVAALAHRDGVALQDEMLTGVGFSDNYAGYQSAWTQERVGAGLAIGGGAVAVAGAVTFVIPQPKIREEVAER